MNTVLTQPLSEAIAEAEQIIASARHVRTQADLAEGYDYLAGCIQAALRMAWAYEPDNPAFITSTAPYAKFGLDNPDTLYLHAYLRPGAEYVVKGRRGTTADLNFQLLNGQYSPVSVPDSLTAFDDRELDVAEDGTFEFTLTAPQDAAMLIVRECYSDWTAERRGTIAIRRADEVKPAEEKDPDKRYRVAGKILLSRLRTFLAFPEWFYLTEPVNTLTVPRRTPGGLATQYSSAGHYDLADHEAMIVTVPAAGRDVAPYQGIQLGSMWYISLDYVNHQTSLTAEQARIDPDNKLRFVISERDPGVANWLERTGHDRGYVQLRWQRLARDLSPADGPAAEIVPVAEIPARLPYYEQARTSPEQYAARIAARRAAVAERMVLLTMDLDGKVVLVAGVGEGLGRSIALAAAREGADVVLAARTASRLDEVAKEIAALGRRGLAVPCDLCDPGCAERLVLAASEEFGQVQCLAYNALSMPPIKNLMVVGTDALTNAFDQNAVAALRLIRALDRHLESVVCVNSMVVRFSQPTMGPYKLAKAAMLAMAQSLATELGPRGIRVNSVAPGHIWGGSLQWYFGYLAKKRGVDPQAIYDETAAATDLKRLPLPDEIAEAVVFLLSERARAITGQCLDVNCGEYHH